MQLTTDGDFDESKRFTEEQIVAVLKEAEASAKTKELCRRHGIAEPTFLQLEGEVRRDDGLRSAAAQGA